MECVIIICQFPGYCGLRNENPVLIEIFAYVGFTHATDFGYDTFFDSDFVVDQVL